MTEPRQQIIVKIPLSIKAWLDRKVEEEERSQNSIVVRALRKVMECDRQGQEETDAAVPSHA